jgi:hypothetical protein
MFGRGRGKGKREKGKGKGVIPILYENALNQI